jgi:hypothetical protein
MIAATRQAGDEQPANSCSSSWRARRTAPPVLGRCLGCAAPAEGLRIFAASDPKQGLGRQLAGVLQVDLVGPADSEPAGPSGERVDALENFFASRVHSDREPGELRVPNDAAALGRDTVDELIRELSLVRRPLLGHRRVLGVPFRANSGLMKRAKDQLAIRRPKVQQAAVFIYLFYSI